EAALAAISQELDRELANLRPPPVSEFVRAPTAPYVPPASQARVISAPPRRSLVDALQYVRANPRSPSKAKTMKAVAKRRRTVVELHVALIVGVVSALLTFSILTYPSVAQKAAAKVQQMVRSTADLARHTPLLAHRR